MSEQLEKLDQMKEQLDKLTQTNEQLEKSNMMVLQKLKEMSPEEDTCSNLSYSSGELELSSEDEYMLEEEEPVDEPMDDDEPVAKKRARVDDESESESYSEDSKGKKPRISKDVTKNLQIFFNTNQYPSDEERKTLAKENDVSEEKVYSWFATARFRYNRSKNGKPEDVAEILTSLPVVTSVSSTQPTLPKKNIKLLYSGKNASAESKLELYKGVLGTVLPGKVSKDNPLMEGAEIEVFHRFTIYLTNLINDEKHKLVSHIVWFNNQVYVTDRIFLVLNGFNIKNQARDVQSFLVKEGSPVYTIKIKDEVPLEHNEGRSKPFDERLLNVRCVTSIRRKLERKFESRYRSGDSKGENVLETTKSKFTDFVGEKQLKKFILFLKHLELMMNATFQVRSFMFMHAQVESLSKFLFSLDIHECSIIECNSICHVLCDNKDLLSND